MGLQFFGEFLIGRSLITKEQLLEALMRQKSSNPRFGHLAVERGYLTEAQADQINDQQKSVDKHFGELAVEMELLSNDQVHEILTQQKHNYLFVGETLCELGHLDPDGLDRELKAYRKEQTLYVMRDLEVPDGVGGSEVVKVCVDYTRKTLHRVVKTRVKIGVGELLALGEQGRGDHRSISAAVSLGTDPPVVYSISLGREVAIAIARGLGGREDLSVSDDLLGNAVMEFCNIVCGNAATHLAEIGVSAKVSSPQAVAELPAPAPADQNVRFPFRVSEGDLEIRFRVSSP